MFKPDDTALCRESDPELWFPDPYDFRTGSGPKYEEATHKALTAMSICSNCPLSTSGECLETAMSDISTIDYGIWAGTLPNERRAAVGSPLDHDVWQQRLRREAGKIGLIRPLVPKRERPKSSLWDYLDARDYSRNGSEWQGWE